MHDKINQLLKDHKTSGRIIMGVLLVTQVLTAYVIVTSVYENREGIYEALKDTLRYIVKGEIE